MTPSDSFGLLKMTLDQKFEIDRLVAEGGFGVVYQGRQRGLDRPVAIKVLKVPEELNEAARGGFIEAFEREAKTIARLRHPNIVTVYDFGASEMPVGGVAPWMALEWLEGPTLARDLSAREASMPFTPTECMELLRPVFDALAYAHEEGIAHRDLKPANMVKVTARRGTALRLLDFGVAKVMEGGESAGSLNTHTLGRMQAFSARYAAPEQVGQARTGPWTDVHAMALILCEMLTGRRCYEGSSRMEFFGAALSQERPTPARRWVDVGAWEPVLARALALSPSERYPDAGAFATALEAALPRATWRSTELTTRVDTARSAPLVSEGLTTLRSAAVETARLPLTASTPPRTRARAITRAAALLALMALVAGVVGLAAFGGRAPVAPRAVIQTRAAVPPTEPRPAAARTPVIVPATRVMVTPVETQATERPRGAAPGVTTVVAHAVPSSGERRSGRVGARSARASPAQHVAPPPLPPPERPSVPYLAE